LDARNITQGELRDGRAASVSSPGGTRLFM
jgi:hypothetical protein